MGAGKSTIGKHLARITGYPFIDLDHYIEKRVGMSIPEFFKREGEEAFRAEELASLQEILEGDLSGEDKKGKNLILSLGGGTVTREACATLIKEKTCCIYLYCKKEELARRVKRNDLETNHPEIHIEDTSPFYDLSVFNRCAETGNVLLTIECWQHVHPGLVSIPVAWEYSIPYGLLYSLNAPDDVLRFVDAAAALHPED